MLTLCRSFAKSIIMLTDGYNLLAQLFTQILITTWLLVKGACLHQKPERALMLNDVTLRPSGTVIIAL